MLTLLPIVSTPVAGAPPAGAAAPDGAAVDPFASLLAMLDGDGGAGGEALFDDAADTDEALLTADPATAAAPTTQFPLPLIVLPLDLQQMSATPEAVETPDALVAKTVGPEFAPVAVEPGPPAPLSTQAAVEPSAIPAQPQDGPPVVLKAAPAEPASFAPVFDPAPTRELSQAAAAPPPAAQPATATAAPAPTAPIPAPAGTSSVTAQPATPSSPALPNDAPTPAPASNPAPATNIVAPPVSTQEAPAAPLAPATPQIPLAPAPQTLSTTPAARITASEVQPPAKTKATTSPATPQAEPAFETSQDADGTTVKAKASGSTIVASSAAAGLQAGAASDDAILEAPPVEAQPDRRTPETAATARAEATVAPAATTAALVRGSPETVAHLAAEILKKLEGKTTRFDIELMPAGLGKVEVRLEIGAHGQVAAAMSFDNPQAAADVRARAADLQRQLEQAGFTLSSPMSFDVAGERGQSQQQAEQQPAANAAHRGRAFQAALDALDAPAPSPVLRRWSAQGLDIRI